MTAATTSTPLILLRADHVSKKFECRANKTNFEPRTFAKRGGFFSPGSWFCGIPTVFWGGGAKGLNLGVKYSNYGCPA